VKLKSLKLSKSESKAAGPCCDTKPSGPRYPYGTCIRLDKEALAKLGLKVKNFTVGEDVTVEAVGTVKSLRSSEGTDYDSSEVEIQLEELGVEASALEAMDKGIKEADEET